MSVEYRPDGSALPTPPWTTIHLANRDLASLVPINFVTHAGISLTSACFAFGIFEDFQAEKCISNLLAAQFKRFIIDLYWDPSLRRFTFCPVSINSEPRTLNSSSGLISSSVPTSQRISSVLPSTATQSTPVLDISQASPTSTSSNGVEIGVGVRQAASSTLDNALNATSPNFKSSTTVATPVSTSTGPSGNTLYNLGPYRCSSSLNLPFFASLVKNYIDNTSDTLSATLLFFQFNLHAAAPHDGRAEESPSLSRSDLPSQTELVGRVFNAVASPLLYQPTELSNQRANLNDSWYTVSASEQPVSGYFNVDHLSGSTQSTADGWPNEYFAERKGLNRILLAWGSIDPQMEDYDFAGDRDVVFPQDYISSLIDVRADIAGTLESGCFYNTEQPIVAETNSSWALSVLNSSFSDLGSSDKLSLLAGKLTSCGISPILNVTLANQTANMNVSTYSQFVRSTIWNWAKDEPRNASDAGPVSRDDKKTQGLFRCALMETSPISTAGHWRVEYCNIRHRVACRIADQPYLWRLSKDSFSFSAAELACSTNSSFSVPRTGLENTYLYQHILSLPDTSREGLSDDGAGVWLNFNSLDTEACWVTTGPNGTCPHFVDEEALRQRTVLVPVIAALVVLLLTALTLFVKCNQNRRNSRKRIRGEGGWDYEGVPS